MRRNYRQVISMSLVFGIVGFVSSFAIAAQQYAVIDLGTLGGGCCAQADKINQSGEIVGSSQRNVPYPEKPVHPFLWTKKDGMMDLGSLYGRDTAGTNINNRGQVIGFEACEACSPHGMNAFIWSKKTGMIDLGTLGGNVSYARGINDRGQIVGYSNALPDGVRRAFLWTKKDGMQDIGTLGGDQASAGAINNRGQIVGWSSIFLGSSYPYHAFLWTKQSGMRDLGTLGGEISDALSVNNSGNCVGISDNNFDQRHAFFWTEENGMEDLGTLGGPISTAWDINEIAQVVGESDTLAGRRHAFIWDKINGMQDLNDLIPGDSGWELVWARGINSAGEIVGMGHLNANPYYNRAVLLIPAQ